MNTPKFVLATFFLGGKQIPNLKIFFFDGLTTSDTWWYNQGNTKSKYVNMAMVFLFTSAAVSRN